MKVHRGHFYILCGQVLSLVEEAKYIGVLLANDLGWSPHVATTADKASSALGFLKRNLKMCPAALKEQAYIAYVRSILDYANPIWDPHLKKDIYALERVNRRAAHYVIGDYHRLSSVSGMLWSLGWSTLEDRRREARLTLFYKIVKGEIAVSLEDVHLELAGRRTRSTHKFRYKALPPATYQILSPTRLLKTGTHYQLLWWMRTQAAASSLASHVWGRRLSKPHAPSLSPHRYIILPEEVNRAIILWDWDWDCNSVILHL